MESERVELIGETNAIIISEVVDDSDTKWIMSENDYADVKAKTVRMNDEEITID